MQEFLGLAYFAEIPAVVFDVQRAGPSTGMPTRTQQCDIICLRLCLAWRHQACAADPGRSGRDVRFRRRRLRPRRPAADAGVRDDRSRHRHEPPSLPSADLGRQAPVRPRQGAVGGRPREGEGFRPLHGRRRRRHRLSHLSRHASREGRVLHPRHLARQPRALHRSRARPMSRACSGCCASSTRAKEFLPKPLRKDAAKGTRYGVIYYGSTSPAMDEAAETLAANGHHLNMLRLRAFPFHQDVASFIADHDFVFVVEQNRDAQMRSLIVNELGIDPVRLVPILHYDGTPITARFIAGADRRPARHAESHAAAQGWRRHDLSDQAEIPPSRRCRPTSSASRAATMRPRPRRCAPAAATTRSRPRSSRPASSCRSSRIAWRKFPASAARRRRRTISSARATASTRCTAACRRC